jgi:hypothetical protein
MKQQTKGIKYSGIKRTVVSQKKEVIFDGVVVKDKVARPRSRTGSSRPMTRPRPQPSRLEPRPFLGGGAV